MRINELWKRKIHIEGIQGRIGRNSVIVMDAETGKPITNILSILIRIDAVNVNECEIVYAKTNENGVVLIGNDLNPIEEKVTLNEFIVTNVTAIELVNPEPVNTEMDDNTAFDIMDDIRRERQ